MFLLSFALPVESTGWRGGAGGALRWLVAGFRAHG